MDKGGGLHHLLVPRATSVIVQNCVLALKKFPRRPVKVESVVRSEVFRAIVPIVVVGLGVVTTAG